MSVVGNVMSMDNPAFSAYLFYCMVLVIKMLVMAPLTARQRMAKRCFASPEDTTLLPKSKVKLDDPDIERVRRAHLNDLENIPLFFVTAWCYLLTNPSQWLAINLFRAFAFARILHTIVYAIVVIPQPARAIAFFIAYGSLGYMAVVSLIHFGFK